ncbi:MAG: hypothetical protein LKF42_08810 [Streptococcaceae bacterium]|jgi:hypothetical protein|nr:hypothetical protein [Streptococcaceae bacterium]MCH4177276.1 hypothetical protein [Streptococcaceae bacterium]
MHVLDLAPTYDGDMQKVNFANNAVGHLLGQSFVKKILEDKEMDYHNEHDSELAMFANLAVTKVINDLVFQGRIKLNDREIEHRRLLNMPVSDDEFYKLPLKIRYRRVVGRFSELCIDKHGKEEGRSIAYNILTEFSNDHTDKKTICEMLEKEIFKLNGTFKTEVSA